MSLRDRIVERLAPETAPCGARFQVVRFGPDTEDPPPSLWGPRAYKSPGAWGWVQTDLKNVSDAAELYPHATAEDARANALLAILNGATAYEAVGRKWNEK